MSIHARHALKASLRIASGSRSFVSTSKTPYGRTAAYRRIAKIYSAQNSSVSSPLDPYRSARTFLGDSFPSTHSQPLLQLRSLSYTTTHFEEQRQREEVKDPPSEGDKEGANAENQKAGESADSETKGKSEESKESKEDGSESKEEKKEPPPPPPHGDKTPFQVFMETMRSEFRSSKEWNESTKAISDGTNSFFNSDAVRKAQQASDAASSKTSQALKSTGKVIGQGAAKAWESPVVKGVRSGVNATGRGMEKATRPVRETKAYKAAMDVIDDGSSSKYGGWVEKEERRKRKELREAQEALSGVRPGEKMEEDPNAGTNVTLHKDSALHSKWQSFKDSNPVMQSLFTLKTSYAESENPLVSTARSITDRVAGFFAENETATVIKKFREMDPTFQIEPFLREMREYIMPEVLDAYVKGDVETLKLWLSAAQFQVYAALAQQYTTAGLYSDGRILDIRHVDILSARILEPGEIPVFIITARTQEVHVYRNKKTGDLAAGMEDKVQLVTYAIGVTRVAEDVGNPDTRGWRLIELQKSARDYI